MWISVLWRIKPHKRYYHSPYFEPVDAVKAPGKVLKSTAHLCALQLPAFLCISLWSAGSEVPKEWPPIQDNKHISVWSLPSRRQREMNSKLGLQGLEYYFVKTNTACITLHSFTLSDWCWQFPQMKLCQGNTWSMAFVAQILTSIRPQSNLFLPTTWNFSCPCSTQRILGCVETPLLLYPF